MRPQLRGRACQGESSVEEPHSPPHDGRIVGNTETVPKRASALKCAIKCRIRFAVTQAEAAIASAYPLHR